MPKIEIRNISNYALDRVSLEVDDRELMVVLGPSGAGKTTLLNAVAGLTEYEGSILFNGAPVDNLKPHERNIGYVPQDLALFNHLNVRENIAFGLKMRGLSEAEIFERVDNVMEMLNIKHLADRYPLKLSGGEQQRVAIARAIVLEPKVLLMDEPFNNLDTSLRKRLRMELKMLQRKLNLTTIFVTHDLIEAEELADRVAVMVKGRIKCVGSFDEVLYNNADPAVREVLGNPNVLSCNGFKLVHEGLAEVKCGRLRLLVPYDGGTIIGVSIPPEKIVLTKGELGFKGKFNLFKGVIRDVIEEDVMYKIRVEIEGLEVQCLRSKSDPQFTFKVGESVYVKIPIKYIRVLTTAK